MAGNRRARRMDVLSRALAHGWSHEDNVFDEGTIVRDRFQSDAGEIWAVWLRTPWSVEGRFAGAVFYDRRARKEYNAWGIETKNGLLDFLGRNPRAGAGT